MIINVNEYKYNKERGLKYVCDDVILNAPPFFVGDGKYPALYDGDVIATYKYNYVVINNLAIAPSRLEAVTIEHLIKVEAISSIYRRTFRNSSHDYTNCYGLIWHEGNVPPIKFEEYIRAVDDYRLLEILSRYGNTDVENIWDINQLDDFIKCSSKNDLFHINKTRFDSNKKWFIVYNKKASTDIVSYNRQELENIAISLADKIIDRMEDAEEVVFVK